MTEYLKVAQYERETGKAVQLYSGVAEIVEGLIGNIDAEVFTLVNLHDTTWSVIDSLRELPRLDEIGIEHVRTS